MASVWGDSWGSAWGDSWGEIGNGSNAEVVIGRRRRTKRRWEPWPPEPNDEQKQDLAEVAESRQETPPIRQGAISAPGLLSSASYWEVRRTEGRRQAAAIAEMRERLIEKERHRLIALEANKIAVSKKRLEAIDEVLRKKMRELQDEVDVLMLLMFM